MKKLKIFTVFFSILLPFCLSSACYSVDGVPVAVKILKNNLINILLKNVPGDSGLVDSEKFDVLSRDKDYTVKQIKIGFHFDQHDARKVKESEFEESGNAQRVTEDREARSLYSEEVKCLISKAVDERAHRVHNVDTVYSINNNI